MKNLCAPKWLIVALLVMVALPVSAAEVVDRIVAVIEGEIITLRELEVRAQPFMEKVASIADPVERESQRQAVMLKVLDIQIGEKMVDLELKTNAEMLGVGEPDINRAIEEVLRMNSLNREQLQAALYNQGMTWTEYRTKLKSQIERARLIQYKVQGRIQVKPEDVQGLCRERQSDGNQNVKVCASHILLGTKNAGSEKDLEELRLEAAKLQAELSAGADFAAYALERSDDKGSPDGNLGCFERGMMVKEFEETAFSTPVGTVSKVVRTQFGFHIIKVTDRKVQAPSGCETPEELEPFHSELYQKKMEEQMKVWVTELRKKAFVDVRL